MIYLGTAEQSERKKKFSSSIQNNVFESNESLGNLISKLEIQNSISRSTRRNHLWKRRWIYNEPIWNLKVRFSLLINCVQRTCSLNWNLIKFNGSARVFRFRQIILSVTNDRRTILKCEKAFLLLQPEFVQKRCSKLHTRVLRVITIFRSVND